MSTALLIIDELGFEVMSREEATLFFRLITCRHDRGAIPITTNKSVRDWTEPLAGDEVLAAAILDRLLHRSNVLNIKGRGLPPPSGPVEFLVHDRPLVDRDDRFWGRRAVSEGAMWADGVVVAAPLLDQDLCLAEREEDLAVEQLVAEPGVE